MQQIYFSDFFEVSREIIEGEGFFDISLLNDLPLFIDPFLIFCSEKEEYQELHNEIIRYMVFLRDYSIQCPIPSRAMLAARYKFSEVKQNYLGFCENGNIGSALGFTFAIALHTGLKEMFSDFGKEQVTKSPHLEKLCLIKERVGKDNISDFTTNLIKHYLLELTQDFAKSDVKQVFIEQLQNLVYQLQTETDFYKIPLNSYQEALQRVLYLKHVIEDCDGYRWFYDGDQPIRREADLT